MRRFTRLRCIVIVVSLVLLGAMSHFATTPVMAAPAADGPIIIGIDPLLIIGAPLCLLLGGGIFAVARRLRRLASDR